KTRHGLYSSRVEVVSTLIALSRTLKATPRRSRFGLSMAVEPRSASLLIGPMFADLRVWSTRDALIYRTPLFTRERDPVTDINDCRISWLKPAFKAKGRLRVQHMPSGYEIMEVDIELKDKWPLDEMLAQLDALLEGDPK